LFFIKTTDMQTVAENILNVTLLEPRLKHPAIFNRFDELEDGQSLTIHNDHDPKPLYYQMLGERGNVFTWEYLEQGPVWWKVCITKKRSGEQDETLGQIAAKDLRKAQIFKKYGLDFCCGGKKTVKEACKEKGLDVTKINWPLLPVLCLTMTGTLIFSAIIL
jgi:regulator of cell morphogenesis and NO signaling